MLSRQCYQQAEAACLLAREYKLDAVIYEGGYRYRINGKHYNNPLDFTVAIIVAFDKIGIPVPSDIRARPEPLYI